MGGGGRVERGVVVGGRLCVCSHLTYALWSGSVSCTSQKVLSLKIFQMFTEQIGGCAANGVPCWSLHLPPRSTLWHHATA